MTRRWASIGAAATVGLLVGIVATVGPVGVSIVVIAPVVAIAAELLAGRAHARHSAAEASGDTRVAEPASPQTPSPAPAPSPVPASSDAPGSAAPLDTAVDRLTVERTPPAAPHRERPRRPDLRTYPTAAPTAMRNCPDCGTAVLSDGGAWRCPGGQLVEVAPDGRWPDLRFDPA